MREVGMNSPVNPDDAWRRERRGNGVAVRSPARQDESAASRHLTRGREVEQDKGGESR